MTYRYFVQYENYENKTINSYFNSYEDAHLFAVIKDYQCGSRLFKTIDHALCVELKVNALNEDIKK